MKGSAFLLNFEDKQSYEFTFNLQNNTIPLCALFVIGPGKKQKNVNSKTIQ